MHPFIRKAWRDQAPLAWVIHQRIAGLLLLAFICMVNAQSVSAHAGKLAFLSFEAPKSTATESLHIEWPLLNFSLRYALDKNNDGVVTWGEIVEWEQANYAQWQQSIELFGKQKQCLLNWEPIHLSDRNNSLYISAKASIQGCERSGEYRGSFPRADNSQFEQPWLIQSAGQSLLLPSGSTEFSLSLTDSSSSGFWSYIELGLDHIWEGWDHLAFVIALIIGVTTTRKISNSADLRSIFNQLLLVVSTFTVAHSITLASVVLGWLPQPGDWVELVIAITIIAAAAANLFNVATLHRLPLIGLFGLIHGFGFANFLLGSESASGTQLIALLGFNLGIELGQIVVVLACLPIAYLLMSRSLGQLIWRYGGSGLLISVALVWTVQRL